MLKQFVAMMMACLLVLTLGACVADQGGVDIPDTTPAATEPSESTQPMEDTQPVADTQPTENIQPTEDTQPGTTISIETTYGTLRFPRSQSEYLMHREVVDADEVMEIFSMVYNDAELELFRIYFGGVQDSDAIGALATQDGEIPIYIFACEYDDGAFPDGEAFTVYCELMEGMETIVSSIWEHPQFTDLKEVEIVEDLKKLNYWDFSLPENMELEETEENGYYLANFYGVVNGQSYKLYSLAVGEPALESVLGTYELHGQRQLLSVESYDLPNMEGWTDRDMGEIYTMMGSINNVIQTVMSGEGFSGEIPE